jgi:hypothetical protein
MHVSGEKCIQHFNRKTWREESTCYTQASLRSILIWSNPLHSIIYTQRGMHLPTQLIYTYITFKLLYFGFLRVPLHVSVLHTEHLQRLKTEPQVLYRTSWQWPCVRWWRWCLWWSWSSCWLGETICLNCSHRCAYCSSHRWYMNMENQGGMMFTEKNTWLVHQSSLAILTAVIW